MAAIISNIESVAKSVAGVQTAQLSNTAEPNTVVIASSPKSSVAQATPTVAIDNPQSSASLGKPATRADTTTVQSQTKSTTNIRVAPSTSIPSTADTLNDSSTSSSLAITTAATQAVTPTTLATSTKSSASGFSQSVSQSSAAASATPSNYTEPGSSDGIPVAGIVVASLMGFLALLTIVFLIFRYCPPVRDRVSAWRQRRRDARTYREALDGVKVTDGRFDSNAQPKAVSYGPHRLYAKDESQPNTRIRGAQETGFGLGNRLSLLMQHAPFRKSQIGVAISTER